MKNGSYLKLNSDSIWNIVSRVSTPPTTVPAQRGARTRQALVAGARAVFERDGFLDARITDIAAEAGVATGSFYTHFESKEAAFAAVIAEVNEETLHPRVEVAHDPHDPVAGIKAAHREYLLAYRRNARLMGLLEQMALIDEGFRRLRLERAHTFARRNAKAIRQLQERGLADATLDPLLTAHALNAMVSRMANVVFVHGEKIPFEALLATLTQLWSNALRIPGS
jgi:AcrR family transcriptional regulator